MIKKLVPCLLLLGLLLSACGQTSSDDKDKQNNHEESETMKTYESENGSVEVPENPKRIVLLSSFFAGGVASLGDNIVGVDEWGKKSPVLEEHLKDAEVVSDENIEKILELDPDLIIGLSTTKNIDKLKKIAPTVTYTYGKLDYLEQYVEIGKLLGKEDKAKKWVKDFKQRAENIGEKVKDKIGEDTTISVIEKFDKQFYVYGDNFGRGTEILYQAMGLNMPEKVQDSTQEEGYLSISQEAIPEYTGDYMVLSEQTDAKNTFQDTETYKNIPAVKNGNVIHADTDIFNFNDPISLDYELDVFEEAFLGES